MSTPCPDCVFPLDESKIRYHAPGDIPMHYSALHGHIDCVKAWIEAGADVNNMNSVNNGFTPLMNAAKEGKPDCVRALVQAGADVNLKSKHGLSALYLAVDQHLPTCAEVLLDAGAEVNAKCGSRGTLLAIAVRARDKRCAELLLDAGAEVIDLPPDGVSLRLKHLVSAEHASRVRSALLQDALECKEDYVEDYSVLELVQSGNSEALDYVLQAGRDANARDHDAVPVLQIACKNDDPDSADLLIKAGAGVNSDDNDGNTPLIQASVYGSHKCSQLLVNAGADVNSCNSYSFTALDKAVQLGFPQCVSVLLQAGADVNIENSSHFTPVMEAAYCSSYKCLELLLSAGVDVNQASEPYRRTPLHLAVYNDHSHAITLHDEQYVTSTYSDVNFYRDVRSHRACVKLLLEAGAQVDVTDYYGYTPLMYAAKNCHLGGAKLLLNAGAVVNTVSTCARQRTALDEFLAEAQWTSKPVALLLWAAGVKSDNKKLNEYIDLKEMKSTLKGVCREVIRDQLVAVDPAQNLIRRVPLLWQLPDQLRQYLLYDVTLEDEGRMEDDLFKGATQ